MKTIAFLSLFLFALLQTLGAQNLDYLKEFRTGTFVYENEQDVKIIRTAKRQTEIYNGGKSKLVLDIAWKNDFTYTLVLRKAVNANASKWGKHDTLVTNLVRYEDGRYFCEWRGKMMGKGKVTLLKVKP